jgi:hypothetical protein
VAVTIDDHDNSAKGVAATMLRRAAALSNRGTRLIVCARYITERSNG